jgi:hypothetical protein
MADEAVLRVLPVVLWVVWVESIVASIGVDVVPEVALTPVIAEFVAVLVKHLTPLCILTSVRIHRRSAFIVACPVSCASSPSSLQPSWLLLLRRRLSPWGDTTLSCRSHPH